MYVNTLAATTAVLGRDHFDTVTLMGNLGNFYLGYEDENGHIRAEVFSVFDVWCVYI